GALGADELREQDVPLLDRDRAGRLRLAYVAACALPADEVACPQDGSVREVAGQGVSGRGSDAAMDGERPAPGQIGDGGAAPGAAGLTGRSPRADVDRVREGPQLGLETFGEFGDVLEGRVGVD